MLASKVLNHSAYLSSICRDAANTWEVDTAFKPHDVLFSSFLGSIAQDHILRCGSLSPFMICPYDGVKPIEILVNKIIVGCFICFYVLYVACMKMKRYQSSSIYGNWSVGWYSFRKQPNWKIGWSCVLLSSIFLRQ